MGEFSPNLSQILSQLTTLLLTLSALLSSLTSLLIIQVDEDLVRALKHRHNNR